MNLLEINKRIKQRPPFQMIERVTELIPNKSANGIKNVSVNEPYFAGHFPDAPVMPGVLIIESAAQLCSLVVCPDKADEDLLYVLLKVDGFKFLKPVIPGDTLNVEVEALSVTAHSAKFEAKVFVDGGLRAKGELLFSAIPKESVYGE